MDRQSRAFCQLPLSVMNLGIVVVVLHLRQNLTLVFSRHFFE